MASQSCCFTPRVVLCRAGPARPAGPRASGMQQRPLGLFSKPAQQRNSSKLSRCDSGGRAGCLIDGWHCAGRGAVRPACQLNWVQHAEACRPGRPLARLLTTSWQCRRRFRPPVRGGRPKLLSAARPTSL